MKKFFKSITLAVAAVAALSSCKGWLDTVPTDSVVAEIALSTIDDAVIATNGLYDNLKYYTAYGRDMLYMGDMRGDNLRPADGSSTSAMIFTFGYESNANSYSSLWNSYYNTIMRANALIANIDALEAKSSKDQAVKDDCLGQAYAVRALSSFDLVRLYGYPYLKDNGASLGIIILTGVTAPSAAHQPRSTVAAAYDQIVADLDQAINLCSSDKNTGHFNAWAAKLLKARVQLYKGEYSSAYALAVDVINNSPYSLVSGDDYVSYWGEEGASETVLEFIVTNQGDIDPDGGFYSMYHHLWFDDANAGASVVPTNSWIALFDDTPNDVRTQLFRRDGVKYSGEPWLCKFIGNKDRGYTFRRNNPRCMRITEAYLIAAEAALETSNVSAASNYLNAIRKRADKSATDVTATLDLIQTERRKEFIGEGHRFYDVLRRGGTFTKDNNDVVVRESARPETVTWNDHVAVLPISSDERVLCPELQQNPGYKD